jgi:hypothetical protein
MKPLRAALQQIQFGYLTILGSINPGGVVFYVRDVPVGYAEIVISELLLDLV